MRKDFEYAHNFGPTRIEVLDDLNDDIKEFQDKASLELLNEKLRVYKKEASELKLLADARYGYWISDAIHDTFLVSPDSRAGLRDFVMKRRKAMLGDFAEVKIEIAEQLLEIVRRINGVENSEAYSVAFADQVETLIKEYEISVSGINEVLNYRSARIEAPKNCPPPESQTSGEQTGSPRSARDDNAESPTSFEPTHTPVPAPAPVRPKEPKPFFPKQPSWQELQREFENDPSKFGVVENDPEEIAECSDMDVAEVEIDVDSSKIERMFANGDKQTKEQVQNEIGIRNSEKTDEEIAAAEAVRKKRKLDMLDVAACYMDNPEVTILKPGNKNQVEIYMIRIKDPNGDILILDGDSIGYAAYVGRFASFDRAMDEAALRVKKGETASDEDELYYMMKNCRTILQKNDIDRIIHSQNADMAVEFDMIIERLRTELIIDHM